MNRGRGIDCCLKEFIALIKIYDDKFQYIKCTDKDIDLLKNLLMVSDHLNSVLQDAVNPLKEGDPEIKFSYFNKDGKKQNGSEL